MSKEYWTEVMKFENSPESQERYKHLEGLYRDCWKNRSMLQEIDLVPDGNHCSQNKMIDPRLKLPKLAPENLSRRRRISTDEKPKLLNKVIFRARRNSVNSYYSKKSSGTLYNQDKPLDKQNLIIKSRR